MGVGARAKLGAGLLLGLLLFAVAVWIADLYVGAAYRHVVIEVTNVDDRARIDVNCRRALSLAAGEGTRSEDLGWLGPDDRIYLSEYNERGGAAWGFEVNNGRVIRSYGDGHAGVTGRGAALYGVAMAQMLTANGSRIGAVGCSPPGLVADSVANYQQAADARVVSEREEEAPLWDPPRFPFALIEGLADLVPLLAFVGFLVAASVARVRNLIRRHRAISGGFAAFNLFVSLTKDSGPQALLIWFDIIGLALLFVSAVVVVWPHTGACCQSSCSTSALKPNEE